MPELNGPIPNPFKKFSNMTYGISIYLQSHEQYNEMMESGNKDVTGMELLIQSGGAGLEPGESGDNSLGPARPKAGNYGAIRNKYFDQDFYLDDIQLQSYVAGTATGGPQNTFEANFTVTEPMGLTFMERLYQASTAHAKEQEIENFNPVNQIYLMVIRFYGYDANGLPVLNGKFDNGSDPGSYIEKWIPIMIRGIKFRIEDTKVVYACECVCPQTQAGFGQIHGTVPSNMGLQGGTLEEMLGADSATSAGGAVTQGLVGALNHHQQVLFDQKKYARKDVYHIEFEKDVGLDTATFDTFGSAVVERSPTAAATDTGTTTKKSVNSAEVVNKKVTTQAGNAGMKIVKFIDLAIRASTYMSNQYSKTNDANKTGEEATKFTDKNEPLNWFKIRPRVKVLGFDKIRQSWAYDITYVVTVYPVASVETQDFSSEQCIKIHKEYDHWFTGMNTEVLKFSQEYNTFYFTTFSAKHKEDPSKNPKYQNNARVQAQRVYRANSSQAHTGENLVDEQAANAASVLYAPQDIANVEIDIVGDPDWLSQSELFFAAKIEPEGPVMKDGSVNYDRSEVFFAVNFNTVVDYNLKTGLADVTQKNVVDNSNGSHPGGVSQYSFVYRANTITTQFEKGKFTQQLKGTLIYIPEGCVLDTNAERKAIGFNPTDLQLDSNLDSDSTPGSKVTFGKDRASPASTKTGTQTDALFRPSAKGFFK